MARQSTYLAIFKSQLTAWALRFFRSQLTAWALRFFKVRLYGVDSPLGEVINGKPKYHINAEISA